MILSTSKLLILSATASICILTITPAIADQTYQVCTGEDINKCPVAHDAMFPCGVSPDDAATSVCTVTDNGKKTAMPYRIIPKGAVEGGQCGYGFFAVTCMSK